MPPRKQDKKEEKTSDNSIEILKSNNDFFFESFKCINKYKCFSENGEITVCNLSPCFLNRFRFGIHDLILERFIEEKDLNKAYVYIQNLIPLFNFSCSVDEIDKLKKNNPDLKDEDYPIGCRIFIFSRKMKEYRRRIKENEKKDGNLKDGLSKAEQDKIKHLRIKLMQKISSVFELLKHAAIAKRNEIEDQKIFFDKGLIFLEKSIEAKEKFNIDIKQPDYVENAIEKAKNGAGFSEKERDFNIERLKKADLKERKEKLMKHLEEKIIKSNGQITPEIQKLIAEIKSLEG